MTLIPHEHPKTNRGCRKSCAWVLICEYLQKKFLSDFVMIYLLFIAITNACVMFQVAVQYNCIIIIV